MDDVHPAKNWRILGDKLENWFKILYDDYGIKTTCFVPSNYHAQFPLSEHKEWVKELSSVPYFSLEAHGHYHLTTNPKQFGECEFFELVEPFQIVERLNLLKTEWEQCGFDISQLGWRSPGWLCSENSKVQIEKTFKFAAIHYEHNLNYKWNCKTFFGHDGIQQEHISIHNDNQIMYTSHIAGNWNHNVWNEQNFEQLRISLSHLFENYQITPKFLKECL